MLLKLQAMMELGATVCTPSSPGCASCPLQQVCQAYQRQQVHLAAGGSPEDAPVVTQYPCKVCTPPGMSWQWLTMTSEQARVLCRQPRSRVEQSPSTWQWLSLSRLQTKGHRLACTTCSSSDLHQAC